jgi:hypothetical protein
MRRIIQPIPVPPYFFHIISLTAQFSGEAAERTILVLIDFTTFV